MAKMQLYFEEKMKLFFRLWSICILHLNYKGSNMKLTVKTPKARVTWGFNPVSRVVSSKKRYSRKKDKQSLKMRSIWV